MPLQSQTQVELTQESCVRLQKADAELTRFYQPILTSYAGDPAFRGALRQAPRAWITFRDAHVKALFPDPAPRAYGSVGPTCQCEVLEHLTAQRNA